MFLSFESKADFILPGTNMSACIESYQSMSSNRVTPQGRSVRVSAAAEPYRRMSKPGNRVYVGNIDWKVSWQDLKDHMRNCGRVVRADILMDNKGRSKGCAIVEYSTEEEAQRAIAELTDSEILGRKIFVREDREDDSTAKTEIVEDLGKRTLIVENVPLTFAWQELKDLFKPVGNVVRADIFAGEGDIRLGLVEFRSSSDVFRAINNAVSIAVEDMIFRTVKRGENIEYLRGTNSEPKKLYVGELAWSVSWQDLKDHFKSVGEVIRADVATEEGGRRSKGFGFVEFYSAEDAQRAVEQLNGSVLKGRSIYVRAYREDR